MNYATSFLCLAVAGLVRVTFAGELAVRVLMTEAEYLPGVDVTAIAEAKHTEFRRNLRSKPQQQRQLDPEWCDDICIGWPFPECSSWQTECYDHRRRTTATTVTTTEEQRKLGSPAFELVEVFGTACDTKKLEILNTLEAAVSEASQPIVDGSQMSCWDVQQVCQVTRFDLWNADSDSKTRTGLIDGANDICNRGFNFSIEAVTDACVDKVTFHLQGPNGFDYIHTERSDPYLLFKNEGADIKAYNGALEAGQYTLTAMPDGNMSLEKTLTFTC